MSLSLLQTAAVAATVLTLTVTGAFAAPFATVKYNNNVKNLPKNFSMTVNHVHGGQHVKIIDYTNNNGGWFKVQLPGPDGWVKKSAIKFGGYGGGGYGGGYGGYGGYGGGYGYGAPGFCVGGPYGSMCVSP